MNMAKVKNIHGGGSKTNINGQSFEDKFDLERLFKESNKNYNIVDHNNRKFKSKFKDIFLDDDVLFGHIIQKHSIKTFFEENNINIYEVISQLLLPDDILVLIEEKTVYIIEKKYQSRFGSVDEKIQTGPFKKHQYKKLFEPVGYKIKYLYILNEFYNDKKYNDVLDYLKLNDCDCHIETFPDEIVNLTKTVE
jgi:hypothetical protein